MKKLTKSLLVAGAMVAATSASAFVDDICPLVGIDYQHVWMKGKGNDPEGVNFANLLPKSFPGASVYLGTRFCEYLGVELGYDWSAKKSKSVTVGGNSVKLNVHRKGGHLDLFGYLPVADCFELMAGIGVGYVNAKIKASPDPDNDSLTAKSAVGRLRVGGNYMFNECIGARALVGWESTSALRHKNSGNKIKPFKDSVTASVGLFYKF